MRRYGLVRHTWNALGWFGVVTISLFSLVLISCQKNTDEKLIRELIESVRVLAQEKGFGKCVENVTDDYSDNFRQKKQDLVPRLNRTFGRFDRLEINVDIPKLEIQGATATAFTRIKIFGIKGKERERLFGSLLLARELHLHFEKRSGTWRIVGTEFIQRQSFF